MLKKRSATWKEQTSLLQDPEASSALAHIIPGPAPSREQPQNQEEDVVVEAMLMMWTDLLIEGEDALAVANVASRAAVGSGGARTSRIPLRPH